MSNTWAWFFGWATILAILLAIPLSVAANIITPKIQEWWATTSEARKTRRVVQLRRDIEQLTFVIDSPVSRFDSFIKAFRLALCGMVLIVTLFSYGIADIMAIHGHLAGISDKLHGTEMTVASHTGWLLFYRIILFTALAFFLRAIVHLEFASTVFLQSRLLASKAELERLGKNFDSQ